MIESYKCSECKIDFALGYATFETPYCPHCGENDDVVETTDDKTIEEPYYYKIGVPVEVFWEGKWQKAAIVNGYRTHDGVINAELENGLNIWFGESRHQEYLRQI